jgi:hypothetical protein
MFVANVDDGATVAGVLAPPAGDGQGQGSQGPSTALVPRQARDDPEQGRGVGAGGRGGRGGAAAAHAPAYLIKIAVESNGTFVVTNTRNGFSKTYRPRER